MKNKTFVYPMLCSLTAQLKLISNKEHLLIEDLKIKQILSMGRYLEKQRAKITE